MLNLNHAHSRRQATVEGLPRFTTQALAAQYPGPIRAAALQWIETCKLNAKV